MTDKQRQGRSNKRKGYYYEAKAVKLALDAGLDAKRQYGSGRVPGLPDDLVIEHEQYEVKSRKAGFAFDEILDDPTIAALVTFSTAKRGLAPLVRLRFGDYLLLKGALKQNKATIEGFAARIVVLESEAYKLKTTIQKEREMTRQLIQEELNDS